MLLVATAACAGTSQGTAPTPRPAANAVLEVKAAGRTADSTGAQVEFTERGLDAEQAVTIVLVAEANASFDCVDGAGRAAPPTIPLIAQVSELGRFHADRSGTVTGVLSVGPPPAAQVPCPAGRRPRVARIAFSGLRLSDVTDRVEVTVPDV